MPLFALPLLAFSFVFAPDLLARGTESSVTDAVAWLEFEDAVDRIKADRAAGRETRMMFIEIYATWCPYCKRLDTSTMTDPAVIEMLNTRFYPVRLDGETARDIDFSNYTFKFVPNGERGYHELAAALAGGQLSYPTLVFMNEDLKVVQPLAGYRPPEELLPILSFFGDGHYRDTPWDAFIETYEAAADAQP